MFGDDMRPKQCPEGEQSELDRDLMKEPWSYGAFGLKELYERKDSVIKEKVTEAIRENKFGGRVQAKFCNKAGKFKVAIQADSNCNTAVDVKPIEFEVDKQEAKNFFGTAQVKLAVEYNKPLTRYISTGL